MNISPNDPAKGIDPQESIQKKDAEERQAQARQETERLRRQTAEAEAKAARENAQKQAMDESRERIRQLNDIIAWERAREEAAVARIGQQLLPRDYRDRIDAAFVQMLKDPDSRKVAYIGRSHGSAVCGTVNARNSCGGYTGQQVFLAYFDTAGRLEHLKIYKDDDCRLMEHDTGIEGQLLRHCGLWTK